MDTVTQSSEQASGENRGAARFARRAIELEPQALSLNPFDWYKEMRASKPVFYDEKNDLWQIFEYATTQQVLTSPALFSSEVQQRAMTEEERKQTQMEPSILHLDPPRHRQLRSLVTQAFTPRTVADLAPRVQAIVNEHLDRVASDRQMDLIEDLAYPLPVIVISELLGVPSEDREMFKRWSDHVVGRDQQQAMTAIREMHSYLKEITNQRRKSPENDLISALLAVQVDGEHLSEEELLSFYVLLLVAGNETTTNLIGNAFVCFDEHPEVLEQMRADPGLIPSAVEEVLRYRSPVQRLVRITTEDTTLGGKQIKAGQIVTPWLGAANRDEKQFPNADTFDIRRTPNRHVGFGHGIHFCVGAPLSRLEAKIAFEIMLARFKHIRVEHKTPLERIPSGAAFFGVRRLELSFENA